jgi:predicted dehydrogenase
MIRIGIAGYGYWGPNLARAVAESGIARLEMIADMSEKALGRAALRHPSARLTTNIREMIDDPSVDAIMIATPVETHFDLAMAAMRRRKHVLVEKPMAESPEQASAMVEEADRQSVILMVDHTFVYTGAVRAINDLIKAGELGDIYYYDSTRVNLGLFRNDVNVIWDLAVHDLAIMDYLIESAPVAISASAVGVLPECRENMAYLSVYFANGAIGHLNVNWLAPVKIRQTLIGGSRRMIIYDDMQTSEKVKIYDRGAVNSGDPYEPMVSYRLGEMRAPVIPATEALLTETQEFIRAIETGIAPATDGRCGLRVVEMLAAATKSAQMRGHPVELGRLKVAS